MKIQKWIGSVTLLLVSAFAMSSSGDEGMWLFNATPKKQLKANFDFEPSQQWLDHLMLSSVRFNSGGSASFVSSKGLVLTNHHVASDTLYKLSTAEHNYNENGFLAASIADEIKTPDLELNQLISIEDVTEKVNASIQESMTVQEAAKARQAKMASIEKESLDATGLRSDVVTLYGGGRYHLYRYKKYTDVRLVWAPEAGAAFFGGDADNFEYPRYCLDVTLFRVYENGKPAVIEHFLKMDPKGARDQDLVFVSGNPGRTRRIFTHDAIEYQRDVAMPRTMNLLRRKEILMQQYALAGPEQQRRSRDDLFGIQNSRKAYTGMLGGLQDPSFTASKKQQETELLNGLRQNPKLAPLTKAWEEIRTSLIKRRALLTQGATLRSRLYGIAETLTHMASEDRKPSGDRLREFRDSNRESLLQELLSEAPIYEDLERLQLADELARLIDDRGATDPLVVAALAGKSPKQRAAEIIAATKLTAVSERKRISEGGTQAISESKDPLILLAKSFESEYRRVREATDILEEQERQA
ncbi:MAG: S46 family peptidase, partial [Pirellula staleyi]